MNQRVPPVGVGEKVVRGAGARVEIAVGLIDDERDAPRPREVHEGAQRLGRVLDAGGIVGRDKDDGAGARGDKAPGGFRFGDQAGAGRQRHCGDPLHVQPHLVIEIPRRWKDDLIPRAGQRGGDRAKGLVAALGDRDLVRGDGAAIGRRPLRRDLGAQLWQAKDRAIEMRGGVVDRGLRQRPAQPFGRRIDRGGLADVQQRPVGREADAVQPAARLHHGGGEGCGHGGVEG